METDKSKESNDDLHDMFGDIQARFHVDDEVEAAGDDDVPRTNLYCRVDNYIDFTQLWDDANKELYLGCSKYLKL